MYVIRAINARANTKWYLDQPTRTTPKQRFSQLARLPLEGVVTQGGRRHDNEVEIGIRFDSGIASHGMRKQRRHQPTITIRSYVRSVGGHMDWDEYTTGFGDGYLGGGTLSVRNAGDRHRHSPWRHRLHGWSHYRFGERGQRHWDA